MSTASATSTRDLPRRSYTPSDMPIGLSAFVTGAIIVTLLLLLSGLWHDRSVVINNAWSLGVWAFAIALVGLAAVPTGSGTQLSLDMPLAISASFVYGPWIGGGLAFIAYSDVREFRGEISLVRGLYNRSQVALSVIAGGAIFRALSTDDGRWPESLVAAGLAVAADAVLNYVLVGIPKALHERRSAIEVLLRMRLGSAGSFALTYLSYGLMSIILAAVHQQAGAWGLATFAMPVLLAHMTFARTQILELTDARLKRQSQALREASMRLADERRDERLALAADLHDEVLPALFQVHLMAQVVRQDLAGGRLLALEEDVPALVGAVERASAAVRNVVRGLRHSPLGAAGFAETLRLLVEQLRGLSNAEFVLDLGEVDASPVVQLLGYQVVREALNNAVRHSGATHIWVWARVEERMLRLVIEDDGRGFDPRTIDCDSHFGLSMMKERVELMGGVLHVTSTVGRGTRVVVRLPANTPSD